jgi:hypothetical protein
MYFCCRLLTYCVQAKYAYRSIAEFVKHVTSHSSEHLERNPFPELHIPPAKIDDPEGEVEARSSRRKSGKSNSLMTIFQREDSSKKSPSSTMRQRSDVLLYRENEAVAKEEVREGDVATEEDVNLEKPIAKGKEHITNDSNNTSNDIVESGHSHQQVRVAVLIPSKS